VAEFPSGDEILLEVEVAPEDLAHMLAQLSQLSDEEAARLVQ